MTLTAKNATTARPAQQLAWRGFDAPGYQSLPFNRFSICALWDDTTDGHLIAAALAGMGLGVWVPANFFVTNVDFEVLIVPVNGGANNISASLENDGDLQTAVSSLGAPWSTTGMKSGNAIDAGAVNVAKTVTLKTTVPREMAMGSVTANTSVGRVAFWLEGHLSFSAVQGAVS
jgi:hypothetical protein